MCVGFLFLFLFSILYLWAFYFVPLIYISVFVPVPYCLDNCGFVAEHPERVPPNGNWNLTTVHSLVFTMQVCIRASLKQLSLAVGLQSNMFASHLLPIRSGPLHLFDLIFHQSPSPLFPLSVEIFRTSGYLLFPPSGTFFSLSFPCLAHCHPSNLYKYHILRKASSDHTL